MISINNISISFNGIPLLNRISFVINKKARIGLAGKNGAGKSTLLKIICGELEQDAGDISMPSGTTIGYLPQQMLYPIGKSVFDEAMTAFASVFLLKEKAEKISLQLAERTDYESEGYLKSIEKFNEIEDKFRMSGGVTAKADVEKILKGLGFVNADFDRDVSEFSGGWRMRIELAKILLKKPDLLLLDEPTNHLDIESIQWLEDFLKDYSGAIILISHDRFFLDSITNHTIEIVKSKIYEYKASYSKFEILRKERIEQQLAAYTNQQKIIKDTEDFIERFRYKATKAVQVQSRIKQLEKLERIEIDETDKSNLSIRFPEAPRAGDIVVEINDLTKSYDDNLPVLKNIYLTIERGEKVAFIGKNGAGKTTLIKTFIRELDYEGEVKIGHNVNIGYFAQNQEKELDNSKTVFEIIDDIATGDMRTKVRDLLGQFLFSGEDIDKKVSVLSGGERARLALAKLMLEPYNLLILDEPTNHLDMHSKDILKQALINYDGTLVVVSHDRDFLKGLVDKLYEFGNQKIKQHAGDIQVFMQKKKLENLKELERKAVITNANADIEISSNKEIYQKRKEVEKEIRKFKKLADITESKIEKLESFIADSEKRLALGEEIHDADFYANFEKAKLEHEIEMEGWEKYHDMISQLEKEKDLIK